MPDFSAPSPPETWKGSPDEYQRLRKIWLWKREWGYDDTTVRDGGGKLTMPGRSGQTGTGTTTPLGNAEAPGALMSGPFATKTVEGASDRKPGLPRRPKPDVPYDPQSAPFLASLRSSLADRWAIDRTAAHDQLTRPYSDARRDELIALTGDHPIAREYGLRTTADMARTEDQSGLRIHHDDSSIYLRDATGPQAELRLKEVYAKRLGVGTDAVSTAITHQERDAAKQPTAKTFFCNSGDDIQDRLTRFHGPDWGGVLNVSAREPGGPGRRKTNVRKVAEGIHAIEFDPPLSYAVRNGNAAAKAVDSDAGWFLHGALQPLGATPSTYDAIRAAATGDLDARPVPPLSDPRLQAAKDDLPLGNDAALKGLAKGRGVQTLSALPVDHPMKVVATAATQMVTGLERALAETLAKRGEAFAGNKLVASALASLGRLLDSAPAYLEDTPRFTRMFDLIVDEVHLLLATCQPYDATAFNDTAKGELYRRAPVLEARSKEIPVESHLVTSGMDALSTGVEAAMKASGEDEVTLLAAQDKDGPRSANYFQIQNDLLHTDKLVRGKGRVVVGTLNPSSPTKTFATGGDGEWDVTNLIKAVKERLKQVEADGAAASAAAPVFVVIDVTVEKATEKAADQELNVFFKEFADLLAAGAMTVTLCKSFQKYPSLGSGKIMLGGVTVVGSNDALLDDVRKSGAARDAAAKDEAQLLTHFIAMGAPEPSAPKDEATHFDAERQMLMRSAENAKALRSMMVDPDTPADFEFAEGLPFLLYATGPIEFNVKPSKGKADDLSGRKVVDPQHLMRQIGVEGRFSFGFQNSSCLKIPGGVRICTGNEPEGEVAEKFYAMAQIAKAPPAADLAQAKKDAAVGTDAAITGKAQWPVADVTRAVNAQIDVTVDAYARDGRLLRGTNAARLKTDAKAAALRVTTAEARRAVNFASEAESRRVALLAAGAAAGVIDGSVFRGKKPPAATSATIGTPAANAGAWPVAEVQTRAGEQITAYVGGLDEANFAPGTTKPDLVRDGRAAADVAIARAGGNAGGFETAEKAKAAARGGLNAAIKALAVRLKTGVSPGDLKAIAGKAAGKAAGEAVDALGAPPEAAAERKLIAWADHAAEMLSAAGLWDRTKDKATIPPTPPSAATVKDMKERLAALKSGDLKTYLPDADPMLVRLKAVNAAIGPISDPASRSEDANLLRAGMKTGYKAKGYPKDEGDAPGFEAKNLPAIVASCAMLSATAFDEEETRGEAATLIDLLLETRMSGVSGEARERLASRRIEIEFVGTKDWKTLDKDSFAKKAALVAKCLECAPYREAGAGLFADALPDDALDDSGGGASSEERKALAAAFLDRLDLATEIALLAKLVEAGGKAIRRAHAARDHLAPRLAAARKSIEKPLEGSDTRAPETLANRGSGGPADLDLPGIEQLEKAFDEVSKKLV